MYTPINTNKEQAEQLYEKHLKSGLLGIGKVTSKSFSYDDEDDIGFVTLHTRTEKKICYQLRGDEPCFVEFMGFGVCFVAALGVHHSIVGEHRSGPQKSTKLSERKPELGVILDLCSHCVLR